MWKQKPYNLTGFACYVWKGRSTPLILHYKIQPSAAWILAASLRLLAAACMVGKGKLRPAKSGLIPVFSFYRTPTTCCFALPIASAPGYRLNALAYGQQLTTAQLVRREIRVRSRIPVCIDIRSVTETSPGEQKNYDWVTISFRRRLTVLTSR